MEPSKEAIAVRITRLNRLILGKVTGGTARFNRKTVDREALLDALTVLYDECNDDPVKKSDDLVKAFLDKYRSTLAELRRTRVCISDFEMLQTIGRGHFGEVHMVREKQTGDVYAMKTLRKEQARKRADEERDVLATATGPWLPKLQYAFQDSSNLYLVMELCCGGDLAGLLSRRARPLPEPDAAFYVAEVAHALKALHAMGYVHRDVKPHNILLDRCGHVKLGDFGSAARLSGGGCAGVAAATADYMAPELLAAADCAAHAVCQQYCARVVTTAISACDYWSLGVIAFELVTLRRPFSSGEEDSVAQILSNIQGYERSSSPALPWEQEGEAGAASAAWRALAAGLLRVLPAQRFSYLHTLQHAALAHLPAHNIRDQAPPWVPMVRGAEDAAHFSAPARAPAPPSAQPFRTRPPFAGQLPFVGYSFVAPEEREDHSGGFNASHDCTAIDLATYKSAEKLAAMRSREIASLQSKLAAAEARAGAAVERARLDADADAERLRARLQADITALTLQNKRLERQVEVEREERMALQRTNQELSAGIAERNSAEVRSARAAAAALQAERDALRDDMRRLEARVEQLQADCKRAAADAESARSQQQHYKDTIAKERAIRRQTLSGGDAESREAATRVAAAEAAAAKEARARQALDTKLTKLQDEHSALRDELDDATRNLASTQERLGEKQRLASAASEQMKELQVQLAQERVRANTLLAQVQELERGVEEAVRREAVLEEQCARTEARLNERLHDAEQRAAHALHDDARHREKVNTLEQLVRQLEREVSALEKRSCAACAAAASSSAQPESERAAPERERAAPERERAAPERERAAPEPSSARLDAHSDTESVGDMQAQAQISLLKEQLERAEAQLQARAEEMATLRQEARAANLARWRKEREYNELSVESKSTARDLKRAEERLTHAIEARKAAEQKAGELATELGKLRPAHEHAASDAERLRAQLDKLAKTHEVVQAEVDRYVTELGKLRPAHEHAASDAERLRAQLDKLAKTHEVVQAEVDRYVTELGKLRPAHEHAASDAERLRAQLDKLAKTHEVVQAEVDRYVTELGKLRPAHEHAASDAERLRAQLDKLAKTHEVVQAEVDRYVTELGKLRPAHEHAASDAERLRAQLDKLAKTHEVVQAEVDRYVTELGKLRPAHEHAASDAERLRAQLDKLAKTHEVVQAEVDRYVTELGKLRPAHEHAASDAERLRAQLDKLAKTHEVVQAEVDRYVTELGKLRPAHEHAASDAERLRAQLDKLAKTHEVVQAEVDRSRNDIRKLKSELQYSEKRRLHAEQQEELSARERAQLRDELGEVRRHNAELAQNNKALQEACGMLEEQLTDLEKLADIHELKNKDLEAQLRTVRTELEACRLRLSEAEAAASERGAAASRAALQHDEARDQARSAHDELQLLRERLENRESRVAELEARAASLESERASTDAALTSAARRVRELQEECATLRTRAHQHHAHALQLQASLADVQEELAAAREAAEAASAWWRTRETKADATLRQQAKLIDFLQAKVEEAGRKKCSLSNKLFGRSGRRTAASPPLRRANRELREEVERLRAKLAACNGSSENSYPSTPKREKPKPVVNGKKSIDSPDGGSQDKGLLIVWRDGSRERMRARCADDCLVLSSGNRELRAQLLSADAKDLPHNEANRAFVVKLDNSDRGSTAAVVCGNIAERAQWVSRLCLAAPAAPGYVPALLAPAASEPAAALYVAPNAVAIGCADGLHSLRGPLRLEWEGARPGAGVSLAGAAGGRALLLAGGALLHAGLLALGSALRRAPGLRPALHVARVALPDNTPPHVIKASSQAARAELCVALACARRVLVLRYDAGAAEFRAARSLALDRAAAALLLTPSALYIAGDKPLKLGLPSGALEAFGMDEPTISAAAKKHSPPKAFLLIKEDPTEILICYAECGVFVDENGKRTRNEDPKWSSAVYSWEFVYPFLYVIGDDKITIVYLNDDAYRMPPCTCDTNSLASTASDCYLPEIYTLKLKEPALLGTAPKGIIVRSKHDSGYNVSIVEGLAAFRSVGASVESLATISDSKGSSTDLAQSLTDLTPQDVSQESVEVTTGFLADIRKRARQLRSKNRKEQTPDDVIKEILTTEVGMKRMTNGRKSPATISEFDSDSESDVSEDKPASPKGPADLCAEMFTRQVRFQ